VLTHSSILGKAFTGVSKRLLLFKA
jgi:hypothetical protein